MLLTRRADSVCPAPQIITVRLRKAFLCLLIMTAGLWSMLAQADDDRLAKVKAAYLYNVVKFTQWPSDKLGDRDKIKVLLFGRDAVAEHLIGGVNARRAQNRSIEVEYLDPATIRSNPALLEAKLAGSDLIYVAENQRSYWPQLAQLSHRYSVLLTSGNVEFARQGGMVAVHYDSEQDRVRFVINLAQVKQAKLSISSKLLKFAQVIDEQGEVRK